MSLATLFHFLCTQHVSDINISIIFAFLAFVNLKNLPSLRNSTTNVVLRQNCCKLLMMDILMSETCWAHKKWNKITSYIKLVFYSSTITMMHGPKNMRYVKLFYVYLLFFSDKNKFVGEFCRYRSNTLIFLRLNRRFPESPLCFEQVAIVLWTAEVSNSFFRSDIGRVEQTETCRLTRKYFLCRPAKPSLIQ